MAGAKPPFDPNNPFEVWVPDKPSGPKPKFDPNMPYEVSSAPDITPKEQSGMGEAALQGLGQGGTLGYLPELQAGAGYAGQKAIELLGGPEADPYSKLREAFNKRNEQLTAEHPVASALGNVAGAAATLPVGGAAKGASLAAKLGRGALTAAGYGAAMNPGGQDLADMPMENLATRGKNALVGGGLGLVGESLFGIGPALVKAGERTSGRAVLKQMGTNAGQAKKILVKGELPKLESFMKDEGLLSIGKNTENVMEHTNQVLAEDGPKIGKLYQDAQEQAGVLGIENPKPINGNDLADKIVNDVKDKVRMHPKREMIIKEMESSVAPLRDLGENANIADVNSFRKGLDSEVSWSQAAKERDALQSAYVSARNIVNDATKGSIEALDKSLGGNQLDLLKKLNNRYSAASTVNNISTQATGREMAKALMGHGIIGGGAGLIGGGAEYGRSHDPLKALAAGLTTMAGVTAARKFGTPVGYYGGKAASAVGRGLESIRPSPGIVGTSLSAPWIMMNRGNQNGR